MMADAELPKVTILGKTFYYYETKKGETLPDIVARYGWDLSKLEKSNSGVEVNPASGTLLYYPVTSSTSEISAGENNSKNIPSTLTHTVKSGETLYGISKMYGVPLDSLYLLNPGSEKGINKGMKLLIHQPYHLTSLSSEALSSEASTSNTTDNIPQNQIVSSSAPGYIYHTVKDEESLYGISKNYNTTIDELFKLNPGLKAGNPKAGEILRVKADTHIPEMIHKVVEETHLDSLSLYKARRGDSWESIASAANVTVDQLKESNPGVEKVEKGALIHIPVVSTISVDKLIAISGDNKNADEATISKVYEEAHQSGVTPVIIDSVTTIPQVGIAVVLTDAAPSGQESTSKHNKNMEFSRGAIAAVDALKLYPFKTRLTVINGALPEDSIKTLLRDFSPAMIISTSDTSLPSYIIDYSDETSTMLVNAFYVKDESYADHSNVVQYLTPASFMYSEIADYFNDKFNDYKLVVAGHPDESDEIGNNLIRSFIQRNSKSVEEIDITTIDQYILDSPSGKYIIYGTPSVQADVKALLDKVSNLQTKNPGSDIRVIGRPSWIQYAIPLKLEFERTSVNIPSRFYFDPQDPATKEFIDHYYSIFNLRPIKAFPSYCATAYDIITYFAPNLASTKGDFNLSFSDYPTLQVPMSLERMSNWSGLVNKGIYIISFNPVSGVERIMLPQIAPAELPFDSIAPESEQVPIVENLLVQPAK